MTDSLTKKIAKEASLKTNQYRGQNISIAYDDIEKGHLDKTGFFTCVNGDGHKVGITCDHFVEITFSGDKSSQVHPEYAALKPLFDTMTGDGEPENTVDLSFN